MTRYKIPKAKGARVRESAPAYTAATDAYTPIPLYHVIVTDRGRVVLPAELREKLNIRDGDRVLLTLEDDGAVTMETRDVAIRRARAMFKRLRPPGSPRASDELIAERRREARMEDREFQEWKARHKRMKRR